MILRRFERMSSARLVVVLAPLMVIGLIDCLTIERAGFDVIFSSFRQVYRVLLLSTNYRVAFLSVPCSVFACWYLASRRRRLWEWGFAVVALLCFWLPFFVVGSRKELLYVIGVVALSLWYLRGKLGGVKRVAVTGVAMLVLILPFASRSIPLHQVLLEFVFPQYTLFMAMEAPELEEQQRAQMGEYGGPRTLLPSFLRLSETHAPAVTFREVFDLPFGLAFHPYTEAHVLSRSQSQLYFVVFTVGLLAFVFVLGVLHPVFFLLGVAYLMLWGRSDFWNSVVFLLWNGGILAFLSSPRWIPIVHRSTAHLSGGVSGLEEIPRAVGTRRQ